jgi:hypothetical protein
MNLYKIGFIEDAEGNEIVFYWEHKDGYETVRSIHEWLVSEPEFRGAIHMINEQVALDMIADCVETKADLSEYTYNNVAKSV